MATPIECECEVGRFTCRYCLVNAKPWHYTLSDGSAIVGGRGAAISGRGEKDA